MRIALAVLLVFSFALPVMGVEPETGTVALLVPPAARVEGLQTSGVVESVLGWKRLVIPVGQSVDATIRDVEQRLGVPVREELHLSLMGGETEPMFRQQWGLENTGQSNGTVDADIDVKDAWSVATGEGVVVAVVDSGVDAAHPELDGQMWVNSGETANGIDDDGNTFIDDLAGWDFVYDDNDPSPSAGPYEDHATFIAGIIAAEVNGTGIAGVAPDARIMNLRACEANNCDELDAAMAVVYAVDEGADVINLSFGAVVPKNYPSPLADAIEYARVHDVLVVTAAGNDLTPDDVKPDNMVFPAETTHTNNVSVAATDRDDLLASFSYYGPDIDIAAPGAEIRSTIIGGYASGGGTSFAAPFVAGAAALLISDSPGIGHLELAARLEAWVDSPPGLIGKVASGRLNAGAMLTHRFLDTFGHLFEADVEWAADLGVTKGCNPPYNTLFCPNQSVTRGQMAAFLARYLELPVASQDYFVDDDGTTFEGDINKLAEAGITKGCNPPANDRYCPSKSVTREQMAAFLVRALGLKANTHPGFDDVPISSTFHEDIGRLATAGITKGCNPPANTFYCPKSLVTRGQMTAFLHRADDL